MNTIRREFPRSVVACFAAVAMMFAGVTESTAQDVGVGVKFRSLIPASRTNEGKPQSPGEDDLDLRIVSALLPKGQQIPTDLRFHLAAVSVTSSEDEASRAAHYTALPIYPDMTKMVEAKFDLKRIPALIPKESEMLVREQFQVAELSASVTSDGRLALMGVPVDAQTLRAILTEQRPAWRSDEELGAWYGSTNARTQESLWQTLFAPRTF